MKNTDSILDTASNPDSSTFLDGPPVDAWRNLCRLLRETENSIVNTFWVCNMDHRRILPGPIAPPLTQPSGSNRYAVFRASTNLLFLRCSPARSVVCMNRFKG